MRQAVAGELFFLPRLWDGSEGLETNRPPSSGRKYTSCDGGTADLCMSMAKKAALLRPIGKHHPDPEVARLEKELYEAARQLGIGPMGSRGINAVLAINLDAAVTHTAALPVAVNAQCLVGRRWIARIDGAGNIDYTGVVE